MSLAGSAVAGPVVGRTKTGNHVSPIITQLAATFCCAELLDT